MNKRSSGYRFFQIINAFLMINTLLAFILNAPIMYKLELKENVAEIALSEPNEENGQIDYNPNPMNGAAEEKTESTQSNFSEYLNDLHELETFPDFLPGNTKGLAASEYIAYHSELLCPPPKA